MSDKDYISEAEIEEVLAKAPEGQGKKIIWTKTDKVKELRPWLDKILKAIGVKSAFISNQSSIGDFEPLFEDGNVWEKMPKRCSLKSVSEAIGVEVTFNDLLVDVAARMKTLTLGGISRPPR